MNKIKIFTDSCSSLTDDIKQKYDIRVIPIYFYINGEEYNPLENKISTEEFYEKLENGTIAKTSCINPSTFIDFFKPELEKGNKVIYISMSSGLSGTYNNALMAQAELQKEYPNCVEVIDSLKGGMGMAFDIVRAAELSEKGQTIEQIKEQIDKNAEDVECLFTPGSITYLKNSGRIKPPTALIAKVMNIFPLINADTNGKLSIKGLSIGRKKTLLSLIKRVKSLIHDSFRKIYLCHTNNKQESDFVYDTLKKDLPDAELKCSTIDCSLGCHCGPKTLAIFFKRKAKVV